MTGLGVPSQGANLSTGAAAASALAGDRSAGKQQDADGGSVFVALLDANAQAQAPTGNAPRGAQPPDPADKANAPSASISATHSLGSGVLVALEKQLSAAAAQKDSPAEAEAPKTDDGALDMSALTSVGWAALIMSATGAAPTAAAPTPDAAAAQDAKAKTGAIGAASAALVAKTTAGAIPDDPKIQVQMPSDAALTNALQPIALNAGTAPVDVKVARSITYLGLDASVRDGAAGPLSASASPRAGATTSPSLGAAQNGVETNMAPTPPGGASGGGSPTLSSGEQSKQHLQNAAKGQHVSQGAEAAKDTLSSTAAPAPAIIQASVGANAANGMPTVQVAQLADVIGAAAQSLGAQGGDTAASVRTANGTSLASMAPVKELDVQLNPASLGALSIEMRLSNGNLSVTIKADKADTLKLIENERGAISDKLKSLNFSVESLNVKALDAAAPNSASADASNSGTTGYGEAHHGHQGQTADGSPNKERSLQSDSQQGKPRPRGRGALGEPGDDRNFGHRLV